MHRRMIFAGFAVLIMATFACNPFRPLPFTADELERELGEAAIELEETREMQDQAGEGEQEASEPEEEPSATPTEDDSLYPQTISDPEDDFLVECDGPPSPGAGPQWADVVELTRVSANVFEVTFRGEGQTIAEMITENEGADVPESFGVSLVVETPENEYIEYGVDWYSYYPLGERKEVHESGPEPAFKSLFNPRFEWVSERILRVTLDPEERNELAAKAQYRVMASVDLAGGEPPWACDTAPALN